MRESSVAVLAAHPAAATPAPPALPPSQGVPCTPTQPLQVHLRLFGFATLFSPSPPHRQRQHQQQPHPCTQPEPGAPGQGLDLPVLFSGLTTGASSLSTLVPHPLAAGMVQAATSTASHGASSPCTGLSFEPLIPQGLETHHVHWGPDSHPGSRDAVSPAAAIYLPLLWSLVKVFL